MRIVLHLDRYGTIETRTGELCYSSSALEGTWNHVPVETIEPGDWIVAANAGPDRVMRVDTFPVADPHGDCIAKAEVKQWVSDLDDLEFTLPYNGESLLLRRVTTKMREALK